MNWKEKPYYSLSAMLEERFREKVYKVALNGGMTCPNRDGTLGNRGCIFCSAGGSGDFASDARLDICSQIDSQIVSISAKRPVQKYIAYFQAYTNTYAPVDYLKKIFTDAIGHEKVVALSIGTRPDCLPSETVALLERLNRIKPIWVELGLQTMHAETARYIRRGYELPCFEQAVSDLRNAGLEVVVHTILGLPGENRQMILQTINYLNSQPIQGIKLQLLHILKNTDLAKDYESGKFSAMSQEEYLDTVIDCLEHLRQDIVVHRVTGDGPKELLIAPTWSSAKRTVLNSLHHEMKKRGAYQGRLLCHQPD